MPTSCRRTSSEVHPEIVFGVPRVWEKIYNGVNAALAADPDKQVASSTKASLPAIAIKARRARRHRHHRNSATRGRSSTRSRSRNVRALIGLDAAVAAVTGAAPIPRHDPRVVQRDRRAAERDLRHERVERPDDLEPAAPTVPATSARRSPVARCAIADDGEVLCRGGNVFDGLLRTARQDGRDAHRRLAALRRHRRDRRRRLPAHRRPQEGTDHHLRRQEHQPGQPRGRAEDDPARSVRRAAIGDNRKFCSAILVLDPEAAPVWATAHGKSDASLTELAADPDVRRRGAAQASTRSTSSSRRSSRSRSSRCVGEEWLPDSDMLTPTSKLKRRGVNARYANEIEAMYAGLD